MEPLPLITAIQPLVPSHLAGEQHQRPPFSPGQLLQGVITAKGDAQQFTLDINGQKITAESAANLQIGQKLDLQVATLTPRIELQIVGNNPTNRWLGNVIPLIGQQSFLVPEVTMLAGDSRLMSQLSTTAQETLRFYAQGMEQGAAAGLFPPPKITAQLLNLAGKITTAPPGQQLQVPYAEISGLLRRFSQTPSLAPNVAQQAADLATLFARAAGMQAPATLSRLPVALTGASVAEGETETVWALLGRMAQNNPADKTTFAQLHALAREDTTLAATHPLRQLLAFLLKTTGEPTSANNQQGRQMEAYLTRLGVNMEQLLAQDKPAEAARTLKFALLELAQQSGTAEKSPVSTDQLVKTLELYQLLQIRLANESLFFLPLPFSFLLQGYLLIDTDRFRRQAEEKQQPSQADHTVDLHLRLEGLGNLHIEIRHKEDRVTLRFLTEDVEKAKFFAGFREELEQWITHGSLDSVQFLVGAKEPVKTLLEKILSGSAGVIDTRA